MNDYAEREAKKKKQEKLDELLAALFLLQKMVNHGQINTDSLFTSDTTGQLNIIRVLAAEGTLIPYLNELTQTRDVNNYDASDDTLSKLEAAALQAYPESKQGTISVKSTTSASVTERFLVAPERKQHSSVSKQLRCAGMFSDKTRENLQTAGTIASISFGAALFLGTGIAGFVLSAKAVAVTTAVVACAATAGTAFPPLAIGLLAAAGVAILVSGVILLALHLAFKNSPILQQTGAAMLTNSH